MIFDKLLRLKQSALNDTTTGQIINLVANALNDTTTGQIINLVANALNDTTTGQIINLVTNYSFKIEMTATFLFFMISGLNVGIGALILLYQQLGVAVFIACGTTFLMVPLQSLFSGRFAKIRKVTMEFTDQRIKIIKEILVGSQIVKMFNW